MKKILFIIPQRERKHALNWETTCRILDRTLMSIEGQDNPNHHTFIVCNEDLNITANREKTTIITTDIRVEGDLTETSGKMNKVKKLYRGLLEARNMQPDYIMFVDADDLIHRRLVSFVYENPLYQGFVLSRGYRQEVGRSYLIKTLELHQMSGSAVIFPFSSVDFPENATEDDYASCYMTRRHHNNFIERDFKELKIPYKRVPFYAGIYTRGYGDSLRDIGQRVSQKSSMPLVSKERTPISKRLVIKRIVSTLRKLQGRLLGDQTINEAVKHDFPGLSFDIG